MLYLFHLSGSCAYVYVEVYFEMLPVSRSQTYKFFRIC